nr:hypothetical protein [Tanacetum cinerariifolium]
MIEKNSYKTHKPFWKSLINFFGFTPRVLTIAWERNDKIKYVLTKPEEIPELMYKLREDVRNIREEFAEYIDSTIWNCPTFFYDDDEEYTIQYREYLEKSPDAVTTILPTKEPEHSLSMGECEVTLEDEIECDKPAKDESSSIFTTFSNHLFDYNDDFTSSDDESLPHEDVPVEEFKIYSNPLFDEDEISSDKLELHCLNVESDFVESLLNRNTLIDSFPKFDFLLKKFSGFNDYDPGEIDVDNPNPRSKNELCNFYQDDPSFPRPPSEPPDDELDLEPDSGKDISAVVNKDVSDDENDDYCSFMFVIQFFLPYLIFPKISPLFVSGESEDIIFDPGISI